MSHLVLHLGGRSSGAFRVLEGVGGGETGLAHHVHGGLEVLVGLARETHDDVRGDGRMWHGLPDAFQDPEEPLPTIGTPHRLQDRVRTGLQGHVKLRHDVGGLSHGGNHVVGKIFGVRGCEAYPFQALDLAAGAQQLREGLPVPELHPVGVHVLPQKGDLLHPLVDQHPHLGEDVTRSPVGLLPAKLRNDAEGAGVVASDAHRHPGRVGRLAAARQVTRKGLKGLDHLHLRGLLDASPFEQRGKAADVVGAEDHIHPWSLPQDHVPVLLGHAAAHRDLHPGMARLDGGHVPEVSVETVVGVLTHRAGVENHHVRPRAENRLGGFLSTPQPGLLQQSRDPLGVVDVHLAAVGDYVISARTHGGPTLVAHRTKQHFVQGIRW